MVRKVWVWANVIDLCDGPIALTTNTTAWLVKDRVVANSG